MKNLLDSLVFELHADARKFAQYNCCAICFAGWNVLGRNGAKGPYYLVCRSCDCEANEFNSTSKAKAERAKTDRSFAASSLRPVRKLTKAEAKQGIRDLGY